MGTIEFSIIVPIYKVEKYINKCIESVRSQSFSEFELILVEDGSPDSCGQICDDYAELDSRVRVIHKVNGGLSSARNAGLEIANGRYIIFLDSDDYWDDVNALENINKRLLETKADVLLFPAKRFYEDKNQFTYITNMDIDRNQIISNDVNIALKYMITNNVYKAAAWNKVIKKTIIDMYCMRFKEGYLSEDLDWCGDLLLYAKRFDFYESPFYVYRQQREGSITTGKSEKLIADKLFMCKEGYRQAMELKDKDTRQILASYYAYEYAVLLGVSGSLHNKKLLSEMKDLSVLLNFDLSKKVKKVKFLQKLIGFGLSRKVLCFFVQIKK